MAKKGKGSQSAHHQKIQREVAGLVDHDALIAYIAANLRTSLTVNVAASVFCEAHSEYQKCTQLPGDLRVSIIKKGSDLGEIVLW